MSKYNEFFLTTTDTVTGIACPATKKNMELLNILKGSDIKKPLITVVGSIEEAKKLKGWTKKADSFAKEAWPGPVTLVISDSLAVRVPGNEALCKMLIQKGPVYMSSANVSGQKPLSLKKAKKVFHEVTNYYDFGKGSKKPSKIIDVNTGEVLR